MIWKIDFFHVHMEQASIKHTSFIIPDGQHEFLPSICVIRRRFFGGSSIQSFRDLVRQKIVLIYMDGWIVLSEEWRVEKSWDGIKDDLGWRWIGNYVVFYGEGSSFSNT